MGAPSDLPPHPHTAEKVDEILEHEDKIHVAFPDMLDNFVRFIGHAVCGVNALLIVAIISNVFLRYVFNSGQVWIEELQWHFYAIGVMFGLSYSQVNDSHIRVDILYGRLSDRAKRIIEIIGITIFVLPFVWVIFYHSIEFTMVAWNTGETSDVANGLPFRWAIKAVIPLSFGLLGIASISRLIRDVYILVKGLKADGK